MQTCFSDMSSLILKTTLERATRALRFFISTLVAIVCLASIAAARPALSEIKQFDDGLFHIAVANVIRNKCPTIDGRMLRAMNVMYRLKQDVEKLGYSSGELNAYIKSDTEKNRMKERGHAFFREHGVDPEKPQDFCRFGYEEIEKQSQIGILLKAN